MKNWEKEAIGCIGLLIRGYRMVTIHDLKELEKELIEFLSPFESLGYNAFFMRRAFGTQHLSEKEWKYYQEKYFVGYTQEKLDADSDFVLDCMEPFLGLGGDELRAKLHEIRTEYLE